MKDGRECWGSAARLIKPEDPVKMASESRATALSPELAKHGVRFELTSIAKIVILRDNLELYSLCFIILWSFNFQTLKATTSPIYVSGSSCTNHRKQARQDQIVLKK